MTTREVLIGSVAFGGGRPPALIAGPCVIEREALAAGIAERLRDECAAAGFPLVFKASYDKANRSSVRSFRGPGARSGLEILARIRERIGVPVISDVHTAEEAAEAGAVLDALQVPAFLCRQTDLLLAAAATGKPVNVKKGQFLAPWDMKNVVEKIESAGSRSILLTERGTCFGYNNLVTDFRSLPIMRAMGYPVVFDATHSVQQPGGLGNASGGNREYVPCLAAAAAAVGCDGIFLEVHPDPEAALSDGPNMVPLAEVGRLLRRIRRIHEAAHEESGGDTEARPRGH